MKTYRTQILIFVVVAVATDVTLTAKYKQLTWPETQCPEGYTIISDASICQNYVEYIHGTYNGEIVNDGNWVDGCFQHQPHSDAYYFNRKKSNKNSGDVGGHRVCIDDSDDNASLDDYRKMQLEKHNKFRATHKSPSMSLDDKLNKDAQAHAEKLTTKGKWLSQKDHDNSRKNQGENLSQYCHSHSPPDANGATDGWYAEEKNWDYKTGDAKQICKQNPKSCPEDGATGHFTQVVWKGSVKLGIGKATGKVVDNGVNWFCTWVVGRYSPSGNVQGQYTNNVLKP